MYLGDPNTNVAPNYSNLVLMSLTSLSVFRLNQPSGFSEIYLFVKST